MKKSLLFVAAIFVATACFSDNISTNDSVSVANTDTIAAQNRKYLDVKTTVHGEMDEEDMRNEVEALMRLSVTRGENGLTYLQEYHDSLNMSRKLYDYIKKGIEHGNELLRKGSEADPSKGMSF